MMSREISLNKNRNFIYDVLSLQARQDQLAAQHAAMAQQLQPQQPQPQAVHQQVQQLPQQLPQPVPLPVPLPVLQPQPQPQPQPSVCTVAAVAPSAAADEDDEYDT